MQYVLSGVVNEINNWGNKKGNFYNNKKTIMFIRFMKKDCDNRINKTNFTQCGTGVKQSSSLHIRKNAKQTRQGD